MSGSEKRLASKSHNLADDQLAFENELTYVSLVLIVDEEQKTVCVILNKAKPIEVQNYQVYF